MTESHDPFEATDYYAARCYLDEDGWAFGASMVLIHLN